MADTNIVQVIAEARVDARSLSEFVFKPAGFKVARRLAPPVDTLQFYIDRFNSLNGDFSSSVSVALSSLNSSVAEADGKVAYIETTVQDAINNTAIEGGVLADTFVTVENKLNQRQMNRGLASVAEMLEIDAPTTGLKVTVNSYYSGLAVGGGSFVYDSTKSSINDFGLVIDGWVREDTSNITPDDFGILSNTEEDVSEKFQIMLDTCFSKNITVSTKKGSLYLVDDIVITGKSNFVFDCLGTLKRRDNLPATDTVPNMLKATSTLKFIGCSDFKIPNITVDGNHINNNCVVGGIYDNEYSQEWRHGVAFRDCRHVRIGDLVGHRASGDTLNISGPQSFDFVVNSVYTDSYDNDGNFIALGRNPVTVGQGELYSFGTISVHGVGHETMPGGLDIEPNNNEFVKNVTVDNLYCKSSGMNPLGIVSSYEDGNAIQGVVIRKAVIEAIPTTIKPIRLVTIGSAKDIHIEHLVMKGTKHSYNLYCGVIGGVYGGQPVSNLRIDYAKSVTSDQALTIDKTTSSQINLESWDTYGEFARVYTVTDLKLKVTGRFNDTTTKTPVCINLYSAGTSTRLELSGDLATKTVGDLDVNTRGICIIAQEAHTLNDCSLVDLNMEGWRAVNSRGLVGKNMDTLYKSNCKGLTDADNLGGNAYIRQRVGDYIRNNSPVEITHTEGNYTVAGWTVTTTADTTRGAKYAEHRIPIGLALLKAGTTAERPVEVSVGYQYFDTTLGKPVYFKSEGIWVDSLGATV